MAAKPLLLGCSAGGEPYYICLSCRATEGLIQQDDAQDYRDLESIAYSMNYQGDEREERRRGLRYVKEY